MTVTPSTSDSVTLTTPSDVTPAAGARRPPVRRARPADAAALTALARAAKASWDYPEHWLRDWEAELSFSESYLETHLVFAIDDRAEDSVEEGVEFGVEDGAEVRDANTTLPIAAVCALEMHVSHWYLAHVWVAPAAQRCGLGSALVRHALEEAQRRRPAMVIVDADPNAVEFYQRLGGHPAGLRTAPMPGEPTRALPRLTFGLEDGTADRPTDPPTASPADAPPDTPTDAPTDAPNTAPPVDHSPPNHS